jgi:hypothetical protein
MEISLRTLGSSEAATMVELEIHIRNLGSSALVVGYLCLRLRYLRQDEQIGLIDKPEGSPHGHLNFPHAHVLNGIGREARQVEYGVREGVKQTAKDATAKDATRDPAKPGSNKKAKKTAKLASGEFLVVPYDTFVQPGVEQIYSFVTALPPEASYLLARATFRYQLRPSPMQKGILWVSRKMGILQYSLHHVSEPHTIEKSFRIDREEHPHSTVE